MPGFNIKYHREDPETNLGVTGSFACTRKSESSDGISGKLTYSSYTVGPSYRFNDYLNGYLLVGQGYGKIEASDEDTSVSASKTSFAYGTGGGQINPVENVAIDASCVYTKFSDGYGSNIDAGTWMPGVDYRF
ncbi:Ail/OmpX [Salmonella enterica]|nr:Ail/OmpX [Salmonella enterica]